MNRDNDVVRVLISDDHPVLRDGLNIVLTTHPGVEVIGEAATGNEAVQKALDLKPDVILMDLDMPDVDGIGAIRLLRSRLLDTKVIVFTAYYSDEQIMGALKAGANGYLLKGAPREELFRAINSAMQGGTPLAPQVAARVAGYLNNPRLRNSDDLTEREREVLLLLARGLANKQIALSLGTTERTIKFHVSSILSKLDAENRTEAVTTAVSRGIISMSEVQQESR